MRLDTSSWGIFRIGDIFTLKIGKANQGMLTEGKECFYVGAKRDDNGVMLHCKRDEQLMMKGNCIIFICNGQGSVGYANYMDRDFIGTTDIVAGYHSKLTPLSGLFIASIASLERPKYSFGRKWKTHLANTEIKLPQSCDGSPDWDYMESYMRTLHHKPLTTKNKKENIVSLHPADWKRFRIEDLFDCSTTSAILPDDMLEGNIPYITRSGENNGNSGRLGNTDKIVHGNCITIGAEGAIAFYQPEDFIPGVKVYTIRHELLNKANAMFIVGILNMEYYKYSYGRARILEKLKNESVMLPVKNDGSPDWDYMENYIKSLPYGDRI